MSSATQVQLLTLLNVSAIKHPRALDTPGGHRGSPSLSLTRTESPSSPGVVLDNPQIANDVRSQSNRTNGSGMNGANGVIGLSDAGNQGDDGRPAKRRKSVVFGGEVGPSGSGFGKEVNGEKEKGKGKQKEKEEQGAEAVGRNGTGNGQSNGHAVNGEAFGELVGDEDYDGSNDEASSTAVDSFKDHFGASPSVLTSDRIAADEGREWITKRGNLMGFGRVIELSPGKEGLEQPEPSNRISPVLLDGLSRINATPLVSTALQHLGTYKDFYLHSLDGEADGSEEKLLGKKKEAMRAAVVVHALNHVFKTRRRIIRNNEKLAHLHSNPHSNTQSIPDPPRDQSFTRPKILIILPLRSLALHYLVNHLFPLAPPGTQIENQRPFTSSFSIPSDVLDPLTTPESTSSFPIDHLVNFRGNSDDNFRLGIKITRKAWRIVMMPAHEAKLMDCDILLASPLGMKMKAEEERSTDLLSSIEVCVVDGIDVMQMQNWEHVQYIFENMNKIPDSPHGCDFSRVKPWYLETQAKYLRQTVLLSRHDTPEARGLLHRHCHNLSGKIRFEAHGLNGVLDRVRDGVRQIFDRIDQEGGNSMAPEAAVAEVEARFEWFTKKTIPALLKSAVMRQNTMIVIPSYFDFVRVTNFLRKADNVSFAAISEYSSNSEISRARTLFFKGKKSFLVVTERFHFYRRYRIRGAKTLVFYSPLDHAQFYSEFLETPFMSSNPKSKGGQHQTDQVVMAEKGKEMQVEVDENEISSRVLFSRFDLLKMERIVGSMNARKMVGMSTGEEVKQGRYEFV